MFGKFMLWKFAFWRVFQFQLVLVLLVLFNTEFAFAELLISSELRSENGEFNVAQKRFLGSVLAGKKKSKKKK